MNAPLPPKNSLPETTIAESVEKRKSLLDRLRVAKNWLLGFLAVLLIAGLVVGWTLFGPRARPAPLNVALTIDAAVEVTAGIPSELSIRYENRDTRAVKNLFLEILYPSGFRFEKSSAGSRDGEGRNFNLPDLPAGGSEVIRISGIFSGSPQELKIIQARLFYSPENATATFSATAQSNLSLRSPDFNFRIAAPTEIIPSQKVDYQLTFRNVSPSAVERMQTRLALPQQFEFISASLPSTDRQLWEFGRVEPGQERSLTITGKLSGSAGDEAQLRATLGYIDPSGAFVVQNTASFTSRLVEAPLKLTLQQTSGGAILAQGQAVNFELQYRNAGVRGFANVQIGVRVEGAAVDLRSVRISNGALLDREVIWNAAGYPALSLVQPGDSGTLTLAFSVRGDLAAAGIRNPGISLTPYFTAHELPDRIVSKPQTLQVKSGITTVVRLENVSGDPNAYRITSRLAAQFNDLRGVGFQATVNIPAVLLVADSIAPERERGSFTYNPSSGRISWRVGDLAAGSASEVAFVLKTTAPVDSFGKILLKSIQTSGIDGYTSEAVAAAVPDVLLPQDRP